MQGNRSATMADRTVRYGLRARLSAKSQIGGRRAAQEDIDDPAAAAIAEAGLRATGLSKAELKAFAGRSQKYLECRWGQLRCPADPASSSNRTCKLTVAVLAPI